jgi:hypothetical protein
VPESLWGTLAGAVAGGLIGGPIGAGLGAVGGTFANPEKALPLKDALTLHLSEMGLSLAAMERRSWNRIRVIFKWKTNFFYIEASVSPNKKLFPTVDDLEDALYDSAVKVLAERVKKLGVT